MRAVNTVCEYFYIGAHAAARVIVIAPVPVK